MDEKVYRSMKEKIREIECKEQNKYTLQYLKEEEYDKWDKFVEKSPQGTIFSSSKWLEIITSLGGEFKILTCYKGEELIGGVSFVERREKRFKYIFIPKFTPFGGILCQDTSSLNYKKQSIIQHDVASSIIPELLATYDKISIAHHISYDDIRPFSWNNFTQEIRYTYVVDLSDIEGLWNNLEYDTKSEIRKAKKNNIKITLEDDISEFYLLYKATYERQKRVPSVSIDFMENLYTKLKALNKTQMYFARDGNNELVAIVFIIIDNKRAYYQFGATHPELRRSGGGSLALWTVFEDLHGKVKEIDLVGANTPSIARFKRGFGGELKHYFAVNKINSPSLTLYQNLNEIKTYIKNKITHFLGIK